jgi:hypothetical protein
MKVNQLIYGERVEALMRGRLAIADNMHVTKDGSPLFGPAGTGASQPATPGTDDIEAELLSEDADAVGTPHESRRSYEERAADGLVRLAERSGVVSSGFDGGSLDREVAGSSPVISAGLARAGDGISRRGSPVQQLLCFRVARPCLVGVAPLLLED